MEKKVTELATFESFGRSEKLFSYKSDPTIYLKARLGERNRWHPGKRKTTIISETVVPFL